MLYLVGVLAIRRTRAGRLSEMVLTPAKLNHVAKRLKDTLKGRAQQVNLTLKNGDGSTSVLQVSGILRPSQDADPAFDPGSPTAAPPHDADAVLLVAMADVSLVQMRSCIYVEPGQHGIGAEPAQRYIPTSIAIKGLAPGGNRMIVTLERQR